MIKNAVGKSNTHEIFQHMVGERIAAMFYAEGRLWIVVESGDGLWFCQPGEGGEPGGAPSYGTERASEVEHVIRRRRAQIEAQLAQLRDLPGVRLP